MNAQDKSNARRLRTPRGRLSYPVLPPMVPRSMDEANENAPKNYSVTMLFPPGTAREPFERALDAALEMRFGPDKKQWPKHKQTKAQVIKDFAEYNSEAKNPLPGDWNGWLMIRANAKAGPEFRQPQVVGATRNSEGKFDVITDLREIYAGRWAIATFEAFWFDIKGKNSGVSFGLGNVQLLDHATRFGGARPVADDEFDDERVEGDGDAFEEGGSKW